MKNRGTAQRSLVLEAVKEFACHIIANEVYDTTVKKFPISAEGRYIGI